MVKRPWVFVALAVAWIFGQPIYCARAEIAAAFSPPRWPPIPAVVQGMGGPITVRVIPNPKDEDGNELWGSWEQSTRVIEIDAAAPIEFRWHTLGHELCHAALGDSGLVNVIEEKLVEALCDAFGTARVQEMRGVQ